MTTTPGNASRDLPGKPPVVDLATWQAARDELLVREKAHTREGDAIAAARRRLPMVEFDGTVKVVGPDGPVPFLDLFQGRDELVVYKHMWYDGAPHQGQCEGCTTTAWHMKDAVYLNARGVSFAILTKGRWEEVASTSSSWATPSPGTRCGAWTLRSVETWDTSSASCATVTACSSPTPRPAGATSRSTRPSACSI